MEPNLEMGDGGDAWSSGQRHDPEARGPGIDEAARAVDLTPVISVMISIPRSRVVEINKRIAARSDATRPRPGNK